MRRERRPARRRRAVAASFVAVGLGVLAGACGSAAPSALTTTTTRATTGTTPDSASPLASLLQAGIDAQNAGDFALAVTDYKKVVATAPGSATAAYANYNLGDVAQVHENDPSAAEAYYDAALAIDPILVDALYNLAIIHTAARQAKLAEGEYADVIAIDPKYAFAYLNLGFLYLGDGNKPEAKKEFAKAVAIDPGLMHRIPAGDV